MRRQAILRHPVQRAEQLWASDRSLTALLVLLVALIFFVRPLAALGYEVAPLGSALFTLALLSGVIAVTHTPTTRMAAGAVAVLAVGIHWMRYTAYATPLVEAAATVTASGMLAAIVFAQVFRPGPITLHRIQGAVAGYLLIAMLFANIFIGIDLSAPGAFSGALGGPDIEHRGAQLGYFSLTTLTTVGYGDIVPVHPFARSLAMLEALVGQIFPAILLARLVSLETAERAHRHGGGDH